MNYLALVYVAQRDDSKAAYWIKKAADAGEPDAMFLFGWALERGAGFPQDRDHAIRLYRAAAAKDNQKARDALARLRVAP